MSELVEYEIQNGDVALQVVATPMAGRQRLAVAIIPGLAETADDWRGLIEHLAPMPAAALTLRGRGRSGRPPSGYTLEDHASDIATFADHLAADAVLLVAFSRSVCYALEYALGQPRKLAGLALLDYPPRHTVFRQGWAEAFANSLWRGRRSVTVVTLPSLQAIEREARSKDFTELLSQLTIPTLLVRGGLPGAALSAADAGAYRAKLAKCTELELEGATHALWEPQATVLYEGIAHFVRAVDSRSAA